MFSARDLTLSSGKKVDLSAGRVAIDNMKNQSLGRLLENVGAKTTPGLGKTVFNGLKEINKNISDSIKMPDLGKVTSTVTNPVKVANSVISGNKDSAVSSISNDFSSMIKDIYELNERNNAKMIENAERQMKFQEQSQAKSMQFNAQQAQIDRDWQKMMSDTAHQREIIDLQKAGLNPVLSANGGAPVTSGASASTSAMSGSQADVDTSITNFLGNVIGAMASMHNAEVSAKAALGSASISAGAMQSAAKIGMFGNLGSSVLSPLIRAIFR